jgi:hypothetical protein
MNIKDNGPTVRCWRCIGFEEENAVIQYNMAKLRAEQMKLLQEMKKRLTTIKDDLMNGKDVANDVLELGTLLTPLYSFFFFCSLILYLFFLLSLSPIHFLLSLFCLSSSLSLCLLFTTSFSPSPPLFPLLVSFSVSFLFMTCS